VKDLLYFELEPEGHDRLTHFAARLQIADLLKSSHAHVSFTKKLAHIEKRYGGLVRAGRRIYDNIAKAKFGQRLLFYWKLANKLDTFLKTVEKEGFFLNHPHRHFARDLGVSTRTIGYLLLFRRMVRNKNSLDPSKPWSYYVMPYYRQRRDQRGTLCLKKSTKQSCTT
jgi:hypothetical protein